MLFVTNFCSSFQFLGTHHVSAQTITADHDSHRNIVDVDPSFSTFLHQMQLTPNVLSIIANSQTSTSEQDSDAVQLTTEMQDELEDEIDENSAELLPTFSKIEPTDHSNDENQSPNTTMKRIHEDRTGLQIAKKQASNDMKFRSFEIKWKKLSDNTLSRLEGLQEFKLKNASDQIPRELRLKKLEMSGLINCIVDQLRTIDTFIRADTMETVAKNILQKFPCLEIYDDDGFTDGLSYVVIKHKLINRNSYLNRFKDASVLPATPNKKTRNIRAGTSKEYWSKTSIECTKEILSKLRRDEPSLLTTELLESSQAFVRHRLDGNQDLKPMLLEMPVLRRRKLLFYHFKKATGVDIDTLQKYFSLKRNKVVEYSAVLQKPVKLSDTCSDVDIFKFLASMVGENLDDLVLKKEVGTRIDDINEKSAGPVIIAIDMGNTNHMYYIYAEHTRVSEGTNNFICAVQDLMCVHYVHNFMYLKEASKFLELIQQYFLKIIPCKGSKSTATKVGQIQRVVKKVIVELSSYEVVPGSSNCVPPTKKV
ncbi:uncharacterized protein LOC135697400 [Ochlerotatus camptorhynchus]|uniref:uncharacterized protein LOC135697400 n=1 Tax=Ochlerotatus camptorhynchus TaxID=644619 RepID=UPI0031DE9C5A